MSAVGRDDEQGEPGPWSPVDQDPGESRGDHAGPASGAGQAQVPPPPGRAAADAGSEAHSEASSETVPPAGSPSASEAAGTPAARGTGTTWGQLVATVLAPAAVLVGVPVLIVGVLALVGDPASGREVVDVMGVAVGAALGNAVRAQIPLGSSVTVGAAPLVVYLVLAMVLCRWRASRGVVAAWWPATVAAAASALAWLALTGLASVTVSGGHDVELVPRWLTSPALGAALVGVAVLRRRSAAGRRAVRWLLLGAVAVALVAVGAALVAAARQDGAVQAAGELGPEGVALAGVVGLLFGVTALVWLVFLPLGVPLGGPEAVETFGFAEIASGLPGPWLWLWPPVLAVLVVAFGWRLRVQPSARGFARAMGVGGLVALIGVAVTELVARVRLGFQGPADVLTGLGADPGRPESITVGLADAPVSLGPGLVVLVLLAAAASYLRSVRDQPHGWARLPGVGPGRPGEAAIGFLVRAVRESVAALRRQLDREIHTPSAPQPGRQDPNADEIQRASSADDSPLPEPPAAPPSAPPADDLHDPDEPSR